jgi:hypothetical protein
MLIFSLFIGMHYYSSTVPKMAILLKAAIVSVIIWVSLSADFKVDWVLADKASCKATYGRILEAFGITC